MAFGAHTIIKAITDDAVIGEIARSLNVQPNTFQRWRQDPTDIFSGGRRSPIEQTVKLILDWATKDPKAASIIKAYIDLRWWGTVRDKSAGISFNLSESMAEALKTTVDAITSIHLGAKEDESKRKLTEGVAALERVFAALDQKAMAGR